MPLITLLMLHSNGSLLESYFAEATLFHIACLKLLVHNAVDRTTFKATSFFSHHRHRLKNSWGINCHEDYWLAYKSQS